MAIFSNPQIKSILERRYQALGSQPCFFRDIPDDLKDGVLKDFSEDSHFFTFEIPLVEKSAQKNIKKD